MDRPRPKFDPLLVEDADKYDMMLEESLSLGTLRRWFDSDVLARWKSAKDKYQPYVTTLAKELPREEFARLARKLSEKWDSYDAGIAAFYHKVAEGRAEYSPTVGSLIRDCDPDKLSQRMRMSLAYPDGRVASRMRIFHEARRLADRGAGEPGSHVVVYRLIEGRRDVEARYRDPFNNSFKAGLDLWRARWLGARVEAGSIAVVGPVLTVVGCLEGMSKDGLEAFRRRKSNVGSEADNSDGEA